MALFHIRLSIKTGQQFEYYIRATSAKRALDKAYKQGTKDAQWFDHDGLTAQSLARVSEKVI